MLRVIVLVLIVGLGTAASLWLGERLHVARRRVREAQGGAGPGEPPAA